MRNIPAKYRISFALAQAIRKLPLSSTELAYHSKLTSGRISEFIAGRIFTDVLRQKVLALAELLGVPADRATVQVR